MKNDITRERLLELGGSLDRIIKELLEASETPDPNPKKRRNKRAERIAHYSNLIDSKKIKGNYKLK